MITAAGVGSGIDVEGIISQLMELERAPQRTLESKRQRLDVELSAFGSVKSAMNELAGAARALGDTTRFGNYDASSSDEAVFTAEAGGSAAAESHEVEVFGLASAHGVASGAYTSSDAAVMEGTWSFSSSGESFDVVVSGGQTLGELRDAINGSVDNDVVVASILNADGGSHLVLNAKSTGAASTISVTSPGSATFTEIRPAADASLEIDGFAVASETNSVAGVLEGVTLNLVGTGTGTIDTTRDTEGLRENLDTFVEQYNALRAQLAESAEGQLRGDRLPRDAELRLRSVFSLPVSTDGGESITPLEMGFTFDKYGVLSIDEARLVKAQEGDLDRFVDAFTRAEDGFAARAVATLEEFTRAGGLIGDREDGIDSRRATLDDQIDRHDLRLEQTETRYRRQFTVMDRLISDLQSTSDYLTQRLGA